MKVWLKPLIENNKSIGVDIHKPYFDLSEREKKIVWEGAGSFKGSILSFLFRKKSYKIQFRIIASRYKGKTLCSACEGTGIREEAKNVKINNKNILEIVLSPVENILKFFQTYP